MKILYAVVGAVGLAMIFFGAILPTRLPVAERSLGMESVYGVSGLAIAGFPFWLERRRARMK